jgi:hypothetical protein
MFTLIADREIRELLDPNSSVIRPIPAEGFLKSSVFKRWHAETIECVEHLQQRFGLRLDKVFGKQLCSTVKPSTVPINTPVPV